MLVDMYIERICQGSVSRNKSASIVSERQGAVVLDAGNALGQLTGPQAMEMAVGQSAKEFAAGIVPSATAFISALPADMRNKPQPPTASASRCATRVL